MQFNIVLLYMYINNEETTNNSEDFQSVSIDEYVSVGNDVSIPDLKLEKSISMIHYDRLSKSY